MRGPAPDAGRAERAVSALLRPACPGGNSVVNRASPAPVPRLDEHLIAKLPAGRSYRIEPIEGGGAVLLAGVPTRDDGRAVKEIRRQITRRMGGSDGR